MGNELFKPVAASYSRQSEKVDEGMDRQDMLNKAHAERRGIPVVRSFFDNDVSASKRRGPNTDWGQMLAAIQAGEFNTIVAVDMDRLLRSPRDLLTLIDLGARVMTVDGEIDLTTADGEFRAMMLASMARFEVRRKAERQVRANEWSAKQGKPGGHWQPFGYAVDKVSIIPEEAAAIRNGAEMFLAGMTLPAIAKAWNADGFRTNRGGEFNKVAVARILKNPRYAGLRSYNGEVVADAIWKPILDPETFNAVQAKFAGRAGVVRTRISAPKHLLVGILICDVCDRNLQIGYPRPGRKDIRNYRCPNGHVSRSAGKLEAYISALIIERLSRPDAHELLLSSDVLSLSLLRDERLELEGRQSYLAAEFGKGLFPVEAFSAGMAEITSRLAIIDQKVEQAGRADVLAPLLGSPDVNAAWAALEMERARVIISRLMKVRVQISGSGQRNTFNPAYLNVSWLD